MEEKVVSTVPVDEFVATIGAIYEPYEYIKWNGLEIRIKKTLSLAEMEVFVNSCFRACFDAETDAYIPEAKDIAIQWNVLNFYTNIELPEEVDSVYSIIYQSGIIGEIMPHIDRTQFGHIVNAIDERISHKTSIAIEEANKQISDMFSAIEEIGKNMNDIFNGISGEDLKGMVSAISDGKINEEKLVAAIRKQ